MRIKFCLIFFIFEYMKKILLLSLISLISAQGYCQDYVSKEKLAPNLIRSDFSVGISPFVFIPSSEYSEGPGFGLEVLGLYGLNKNFSTGGFLKIKSELNGSAIRPPGTGYGNGGKAFQNAAWSLGVIAEYKIFNKVGFNLRAGYESIILSTSTASQYLYNPSTGNYSSVAIDNSPGFVYGGGISLYIKKPNYKRAVHSFNWTITFEGNNMTEFPVLNLGTNKFNDTEMNAFYFQFGWRIQFHGLKPKN
jgi:hypothetical protein